MEAAIERKVEMADAAESVEEEKVLFAHDNSSCHVMFERAACSVKVTLDMFIVSDSAKSRVLVSYPTSALLGANFAEHIGTTEQNSSKTAAGITAYKMDVVFFASVPKRDRVRGDRITTTREKKIVSLLFSNIASSGPICTQLQNVVYRLVYQQISAAKETPITSPPTTTTPPTSTTLLSEFQMLPPPTPPRFVVFVNPNSGHGHAFRIWKANVEPMLLLAKINVELVVTQYANHAREYVTTLVDYKQFNCYMTIGGDGILYEIINGFASRENGMNILKELSFAPIPGGSGNGLIKSILFECYEDCTADIATFAAIRSHGNGTVPLDLSRVVTNDNQVHYSFHSIFWGIMCDFIRGTEQFRWFGPKRFQVGAIYVILRRRVYQGRLCIKLIPNELEYDHTEYPLRKIPCNRLLDGEAVDANNWLTLTGKFTMVTVSHGSHVTTVIHSGPGVRIADGVLTLLVTQDVGRVPLAKIFKGMRSGQQVYNPSMRVFRCTEFSLETLPSCKYNDIGLFSLDGEHIPYGLMNVSVAHKATNVCSLSTTIPAAGRRRGDELATVEHDEGERVAAATAANNAATATVNPLSAPLMVSDCQ